MTQKAIISLFNVLILISIAFCLCGHSYAQDEAIWKSNALSYTLDNGLTVVLKQDRRTPTFFAGLYVRAGSATEGGYSGSGITHLIEHMIFKGTSSRSADEIAKQVKSLGADINAHTTLDYTAFTLEGAVENLEPLVDIFYDIISDPLFDQSELEKEKSVVRTEMRYIDDNPRKYLSAQFWQSAYIAHPYRNPIIGYPHIFDTLTREDVKKYYDKFYVPNNMVLVIVGDIDMESTKDIINQNFAMLQRKSLTTMPVVREPGQIAPRIKTIEYPTSRSYMLMGFHSVGLSDKDIFALDTLAVILGAGRSSLLHEEIYNKQNLVYDINAYNYTPFHPGLFLIGASFENENRQKVVEEIYGVINGIKKSKIKKRDLDKAKNQVIGLYMFNKQTQAGLGSDLGMSYLLTGDIDFSMYYLEGIKSVTADDVSRVINNYIVKENMTEVCLVPADQSSESLADLPRVPIDTSRETVKRTLPNGIRLLLTEDRSLPVASIQVCVKGGLYVEDQYNNGISNLVSQMLLKGTAGRSEEDVFYSIESIGGRLSAYSGNNSFGLSMDVMSQDIRKGVDILSDVLIRPAFNKDKLRILKDDAIAKIKAIEYDIFSSSEQELRKQLFTESPYAMSLYGNRESLQNITRGDIIGFYRSHCVGPNMVVSVCGDIDIESLSPFIEARLRGIKNKPAPQVEVSTLLPLEQRIDILNQMDRKQSVVMIGFRSPGIQDQERYPLQVLSSIFSGSGGRLYENIRQQEAMAYTLGVFGMTGMDIGSFIFYAATTSENIDLVTGALFDEIKLVNEGDISEGDIDSAKKSLISQHYINLQTASAFAQKIALDELYGLGFDLYHRFPDIIDSIDKDQVIQISNKYLNPNACVLSKTIPGDRED
jgi:zinc protease